MLQLRKPYLLFLGDVDLKSDAKTAFGLRDWCAADVMGEWALPAATVTLGLPRLSPAQAASRGAGSLVIGVAAVGGVLPERWLPELKAALEAGLDIVSGLHSRLTSFPSLVLAAQRGEGRLHDVRHCAQVFPAGTGRKRSGRRVMTVGTDCALGKKYTALALTQALQARGAPATFRATGQTGIMIASSGVAVDAVIADFIAGAAEALSPDNEAGHWDVIEGQGAARVSASIHRRSPMRHGNSTPPRCRSACGCRSWAPCAAAWMPWPRRCWHDDPLPDQRGALGDGRALRDRARGDHRPAGTDAQPE